MLMPESIAPLKIFLAILIHSLLQKIPTNRCFGGHAIFMAFHGAELGASPSYFAPWIKAFYVISSHQAALQTYSHILVQNNSLVTKMSRIFAAW